MKKKRLILGIVAIIILSITIPLGYIYYTNIQRQNDYDNRYVSPVNENYTTFLDTDYQISIYNVYRKDLNLYCEESSYIVIFKTYDKSYTLTSPQICATDPYFYIEYDGQYLTLNQAVDQKLISFDNVIDEFINVHFTESLPGYLEEIIN